MYHNYNTSYSVLSDYLLVLVCTYVCVPKCGVSKMVCCTIFHKVNFASCNNTNTTPDDITGTARAEKCAM